jgi:hypothetical protein
MSEPIQTPYANEWAEEAAAEYYVWGPDPVAVELEFQWQQVDDSEPTTSVSNRAHKFGTGDIHDQYQVFPRKGII